MSRLKNQLRVAPKNITEKRYGELTKLIGSWVGRGGWNVVAVPLAGDDPDSSGNNPTAIPMTTRNGGDFIFKVQRYYERLTVTPVYSPVPNRKMGETGSQTIQALKYTLTVNNLENDAELHTENGMFLFQKDDYGKPEDRYVRQASVPHGNVITATGPAKVDADKNGLDVDFEVDKQENTANITGGKADAYKEEYNEAVGKIKKHFAEFDFDPIIPRAMLQKDLNKKLKAGEKLIELTTLDLKAYSPNFPLQQKGETEEERSHEDTSYGNKNGISNIPFIVNNADTTLFRAVFWIEEMQKSDGTTYMQLQYSQKTNIVFPSKYTSIGGLDGGIGVWPHINVNTLIKV